MAASEDLLKARRESAELMGLNYDRLSPADVLRCDLISTLRLVIDDAGGTVLEGGSTDLAKLITATESLIRLLPGHELPEPAPVDGGPNDPRQIMWENYLGMRRRGEIADLASTFEGRGRRIAELEAEIAALKAGAPAPDEPSAGGGNPPSSGGNAPAGNVVSMKPPPAGAAASPAAPRTWDDTPGGQAWQAWHDAGGGYVRDRWRNNNI
jgi:hypothetical protein